MNYIEWITQLHWQRDGLGVVGLKKIQNNYTSTTKMCLCTSINRQKTGGFLFDYNEISLQYHCTDSGLRQD